MSLQLFQPGGDLIKDAVFLSLKAAYPGVGRYPVSESSTDLATYIKPSGWNLVLPSEFQFPTGQNGFYRTGNNAAFVATKGDTLAIVVQGSDYTGLPRPEGVKRTGLLWDAANFLSQTAGTAQDFLQASANPQSGYDILKPFIKAALDYAHSHGFHHILVTGHSLGGQISERFAVDPPMEPVPAPPGGLNLQPPTVAGGSATLQLQTFDPNAQTPQQIAGGFNPADISVITFGSAGLPTNLMTTRNGVTSLQSQVLNIYNNEDPVYRLYNEANPEQAHVGTQKVFYNSDVTKYSQSVLLASLGSNTLGSGSIVTGGIETATVAKPDILEAHANRYYDEVDALANSALTDFAAPDTVFVFGKGDNNAALSANTIQPDRPQFLTSLGGNEHITGGPGNDLVQAVSGDHILTGGGGINRYQIVSGKDTITDFDFDKNALFLASTTPITGQLGTNGTILTFSGGSVYLQGVDLRPQVQAGLVPWLKWLG